ncbi:hypothetical protein AB0G60_24160 [Streptomyces angustmyceticus]|uniref:Cysteine dioxygenase n=1 Tax=Streptomyces angustmyceticus TaxID=285578 RepID=A0A5J4LD10_9ACTN|nr:hypothetical protein [Streptomyces angustmyceticus]UAL66054.1 hypothetical protein K7396_05450 [Streptomyces angustmyceticus]GES29226.1 hypothetical protein San01_17130 [Streptomyces angustmyceticus]
MQVEEARRLLAERLGGGPGPPSPESARAVTAQLAHPDTLGPLVRRLSAGDLDLAECTRLSYRHVLGFDKLVLLAGAPRFMLRIHFWHGGTGAAPEDIHNHRCAIASAVVRGHVRMECYEPAANGVPATAYRETIDGPGGAWRLRRVGDARLRLVCTQRYGAGRSYGLAARTLHRVVSEEPTVTLFLETVPQRSVTDVYVRHRGGAADRGGLGGSGGVGGAGGAGSAGSVSGPVAGRGGTTTDGGSVTHDDGDRRGDGGGGGDDRASTAGRTDHEGRTGARDRTGAALRAGGAERADPPPKTPLPPAVYLAELDSLAGSLGY